MEYKVSKSFLSIMALMLKAILYPGCELFITTGGKEQAASITMSKVEEICKLIPALQNEIKWDRGATKKTKDSVEYVFKNGSKINILPAKESSRGQRRTGRKIFKYFFGQTKIHYSNLVEDWGKKTFNSLNKLPV